MMENKFFPQLRMLLTDYCDSQCAYCRPSGEGNLPRENIQMDYPTAQLIARLFSSISGTEIKLTGGDPVYWPHLIEFIKYLKSDLCFKKVELITRSTKLNEIVSDLQMSGLDVLNFSLDTMSPERYSLLTKKRDFPDYVKTIEYCATRFHCKINSVVLFDDDWVDLIEFCERTGVEQLKLLDFIDDIEHNNGLALENIVSFAEITKRIKELSIEETTIFQGGLGHPMQQFTLPSGLKVICKDSSSGAWYSKPCLSCKHYPCHDALMALRVSPANTFQLCLLNDKMHWKYDPKDPKDIEEKLHSILSVYLNAFFVN